MTWCLSLFVFEGQLSSGYVAVLWLSASHPRVVIIREVSFLPWAGHMLLLHLGWYWSSAVLYSRLWTRMLDIFYCVLLGLTRSTISITNEVSQMKYHKWSITNEVSHMKYHTWSITHEVSHISITDKCHTLSITHLCCESISVCGQGGFTCAIMGGCLLL